MVSDEDKLKADLYWKMYNEHATQARHHEILRAGILTILVTVSAAILSLYKADKATVSATHPFYIGLLLIVLGTLGGLLGYKHYERNRLHVSTLRQFRKELDEILRPYGGSITAPNDRGREDNKRKFPISSERLRVYYLWIAVFLFIIGMGVMIAGSALDIKISWKAS